ncbi:MAG: 4-hydroxy-tetrahydrodipicolinate reductase [Candidatus Dormibacterales bacterium]
MIRVVVAGYRGRTGSEVVGALESAGDMQVAARAGSGDDLESILAGARADALVDFTRAASALGNALLAVAAGAAPVVGTTGLDEGQVNRLEAACQEAGVGGVVAPNFAVGAVLMMKLAALAAPYFDAAEIIEAHHDGKLDAPSGTALATARRLAAARAASPFARRPPQTLSMEGVRGGEHGGVGVHSLRLPGVLADQEVVFGLPGQTLSISHRTTSRAAFAPGVMIALRRVVSERRFFRGLEDVLGLG